MLEAVREGRPHRASGELGAARARDGDGGAPLGGRGSHDRCRFAISRRRSLIARRRGGRCRRGRRRAAPRAARRRRVRRAPARLRSAARPRSSTTRRSSTRGGSRRARPGRGGRRTRRAARARCSRETGTSRRSRSPSTAGRPASSSTAAAASSCTAAACRRPRASSTPARTARSAAGRRSCRTAGRTSPSSRSTTARSGAIFRGLAIAKLPGGAQRLYATDFHNDHVVVFDGQLAAGSCAAARSSTARSRRGTRRSASRSSGSHVFVTYASPAPVNGNDSPTGGYVDEFDLAGTLVARVGAPGHARRAVGARAGAERLRPVRRRPARRRTSAAAGSTRTRGAASGWTFDGQLPGRGGKPLTVVGVWGISFGNGGMAGPKDTLFFAAGPHRWRGRVRARRCTGSSARSRPRSPRADAGARTLGGMEEIGLFPLGIVLLPSEHVPLHIFEPRYRELIAECLEHEREFGLIYADGDGVREVGTRARVIDVLEEFEDGRLNVVVEGGARFRVERLTRGRTFLTAVVVAGARRLRPRRSGHRRRARPRRSARSPRWPARSPSEIDETRVAAVVRARRAGRAADRGEAAAARAGRGAAAPRARDRAARRRAEALLVAHRSASARRRTARAARTGNSLQQSVARTTPAAPRVDRLVTDCYWV